MYTWIKSLHKTNTLEVLNSLKSSITCIYLEQQNSQINYL